MTLGLMGKGAFFWMVEDKQVPGMYYIYTHMFLLMFTSSISKMVGFPNNHGFPTKNDHDLGCEMGKPTI